MARTKTLVALLILLGFPGISWGANALIVYGSISPVTIRDNLKARLEAQSLTVTTSATVPEGSLSTYQQIWDVRVGQAGTANLSASEKTAYTTYLTGGGSLYLAGENYQNFKSRDDSLMVFLGELLGSPAGTHPFGNPQPSGGQTVNPPFTGPNPLTSIGYSAGAEVPTVCDGAYVTWDSGNGLYGAGLVFQPGSLPAAPAGTVILVFDTNFMDSTDPAVPGTALMDNIIGYLAAPTAVPKPAKVAGAMTVAGTFMPGGTVTYTVVLTNNGCGPQGDGARYFRFLIRYRSDIVTP